MLLWGVLFRCRGERGVQGSSHPGPQAEQLVLNTPEDVLNDPGKTSPHYIAFGAPYTSLWCAPPNQEPSFLHIILFLISTRSGRFPQGIFTSVLGSPPPGPLCFSSLHPVPHSSPMTFSLPVNNSNCLNYCFFIFWDYSIIASWYLDTWFFHYLSVLFMTRGSVFCSSVPSDSGNHCLHSQ